MKTITSATIAFATLGLAATPAQADSSEHHSWEWPLYEPARNSSGQVVRGRPRRLIFSSLGEANPDWTHPGIDIMGNHINQTTRNGQSDPLPDVTVIPVDSELIWVFNYSECGARFPDAGTLHFCRLWFRTQDTKYLYYFGHVHYNNAAFSGDVEVNSHLRDAITTSVASTTVSGGQSCDATHRSNCQFARGDLGPTLSGWTTSGYTNNYDHLHFDIVDRNQDYDLVNPLTYLKTTATSQAGTQFDVTDNVRPTLVKIDFIPDDPDPDPSHNDPNGKVASVATQGACGLEIKGKVDIMAVAYDDFRMWDFERKDGAMDIALPFNTTDHIGLYKATYSVKRVGDTSARQSGIWYQFDSAPLFCPGPLKGNLCPFADPSDRQKNLKIDGGTNDEGLFSGDYFHTGEGSRALGDWPYYCGYGCRLYRQPLFSSPGWGNDEHIPLVLTNEWGTEGDFFGGQQSGYTTHTNWDTTDSSKFPDGRYQVDAVVFDNEELHQAGKSVLINVHNSSSPLDTQDSAFRDIYIADSDSDVGAVPSNVGDQPYWSSPDILVVRADKDNPPQGPHNTLYRADQILPGVDYHVWVQVHHAVCNSIQNVKLRLAHADPSTFNKPDQWAPITTGFQGPPGKPDGETLDAGSDKQWVGPFDWTPGQSDLGAYGHRCLLAAVQSQYETTSDDDMKDVPGHNNVAQRNVEIGETMKFIFSNPFSETSQVGLQLSASKEMNCYYKLSLDYDSAISDAWSGVSQDFEVAHVGTKLEVTIKARNVNLPPVSLPGYTQKEITGSVSCQIDLDFTVDVESTVNGQSYGGMTLELVRRTIP